MSLDFIGNLKYYDPRVSARLWAGSAAGWYKIAEKELGIGVTPVKIELKNKAVKVYVGEEKFAEFFDPDYKGLVQVELGFKPKKEMVRVFFDNFCLKEIP